jgi:hypothetical protein
MRTVGAGAISIGILKTVSERQSCERAFGPLLPAGAADRDRNSGSPLRPAGSVRTIRAVDMIAFWTDCAATVIDGIPTAELAYPLNCTSASGWGDLNSRPLDPPVCPSNRCSTGHLTRSEASEMPTVKRGSTPSLY